MTSSGIKRGVATAAVSALAVAGLPFLAGTASAAPGDNFTVEYTGPALNGGDEGALVVIRFEDGEITPANLQVTGTDSPTMGSEDTAEQTVTILDRGVVQDDPDNAAFSLVEVRVGVTTSTVGDAATFRLFENDDLGTTLDAGEARQQVSVSTAGPLASIDVSPAAQSSPENIESGAYTVTLMDAAGRTTQLLSTDSLTITPEDVSVTVTETGPDTAAAGDNSITSDEIVRGTDTFTANGTTAGSYDILVEDFTTPTIEDTAVLNVTESANLTANEIDIVTAADTWDGFGNTPDSDGDNTTTFVRVDQNTIRFDFDAADAQAGANVQLAVNGFGGVTFAGQDQATYTTTLDASGNGSITVTADAATIQEGDGFTVDINGFAQTIVFDRAEADSIDGESATYFCQDDADCTVTAVVLDQFGNPVTTGEVEASRSGHNTDATPQRKPVGSDGTVDFTFTDTNPVDGGTDTVLFEYFVDQFDNTPELGMSDSSTTIKYSATGQGSDYVISLDGENTEGANYDADDAAVIPLWDTVANTTTGVNDEDADITIANGEANQAVTLSVDNGALILEPGEVNLSEGSASVDATLDAITGVLPAGYRVIGTTSGLVTLTVDSANRTETAQLTVLAQDDADSARNVTLTAPATVPNGTNQVTFTAVFTDAFGNPVPGVANGVLNKQVTGPGFYQDGDAQSDANGVLNLNVRVDSGATGDLTLTVDATDGVAQFGADADRLKATSVTDDGEGLAESSDVATATTTVLAPEREDINASLRGKNNGAKADRLKVVAPDSAAGATVKLFKFKKNGKKVLVKTGTLNDNGNKKFRVADKNGRKFTQYVAKVKATDSTKGDRTNRRRVR